MAIDDLLRIKTKKNVIKVIKSAELSQVVEVLEASSYSVDKENARILKEQIEEYKSHMRVGPSFKTKESYKSWEMYPTLDSWANIIVKYYSDHKGHWDKNSKVGYARLFFAGFQYYLFHKNLEESKIGKIFK